MEEPVTALPADLDPDLQRQIQALTLSSAGLGGYSGIRWPRLLQTAREVAEGHL
ncbi:hypothetical protein ACWD7F_28840 [Streptomyces sp. NPDC005122]